MSCCSRTSKCVFAGLGMLSLVNAATAADLPLKAPAASDAVFSWTGFYIGGHFGYAAGRPDWSATDAGAAMPALSGSFDLFNGYDAFKGTGSYFFGLQAGYNYVLPSHWLIGFEADASAPNALAGNQTVFTPAGGQATYTDTVLDFGTARARVGYAFDRWLAYGTGGVAWSYDRLQRTQLAGGIVTAGTTETAFPVGAGVGPRAPASSFRSRRTGLRRSNISRPDLATAGSLSRPLANPSIWICRCRPLSRASIISSAPIRRRTRPSPRVSRRSTLAISPCTARPPLSNNRRAVPRALCRPEQPGSKFRPRDLDLDLYVGYRPWKGAEIWGRS